jgi:hypothetical protein
MAMHVQVLMPAIGSTQAQVIAQGEGGHGPGSVSVGWQFKPDANETVAQATSRLKAEAKAIL